MWPLDKATPHPEALLTSTSRYQSPARVQLLAGKQVLPDGTVDAPFQKGARLS